MITRILKERELREYLSAMVDDNCTITHHVIDIISRFFQGHITKSDLFTRLEEEWKYQEEQ